MFCSFVLRCPFVDVKVSHYIILLVTIETLASSSRVFETTHPITKHDKTLYILCRHIPPQHTSRSGSCVVSLDTRNSEHLSLTSQSISGSPSFLDQVNKGAWMMPCRKQKQKYKSLSGGVMWEYGQKSPFGYDAGIVLRQNAPVVERAWRHVTPMNATSVTVL